MEKLDATFWDNRYLTAQTGWDIGSPSIPLKEYIDQLTSTELQVLIPGCGNAYEASYLLQNGFKHVTVVDISPVLTEKLKENHASWLNKELTVLTVDFFTLEGSYDLILEQTFFCALDPSLRPAYVKKMHELLKKGGKLVGLLFDRSFEGGPPFGGHREEYLRLFSPYFAIRTMENSYNSIKPRQGTELFIILEKK